MVAEEAEDAETTAHTNGSRTKRVACRKICSRFSLWREERYSAASEEISKPTFIRAPLAHTRRR